MIRIPFNRAVVGERELAYVREALAGTHLAGDGPFTARCETLLAELLGGPTVHLVHSATAGLEMAALLADIGPGDEVVMPSFTFVSCANAVALRGATPVFVDIRPDTLGIDVDRLRAAITDRTRAVVAIHYAGVPCAMDAVMEIAAERGLVVIEDAAQALGSTSKGRPAATLGHLGVISFHETKNVVSGEGGALVVNDARFEERVEVVRNRGTDRAAFLRGETPQYTWLDLGSSYAPTELVAAVLLAQLERVDAITEERRALWARYDAGLAGIDAGRPVVPADVEHNGHLYYLLLRDAAARDRFIAAMAARGISTPFHFVALHDAPGGRRLGRVAGPMTVTDDVAGRLVRLPLWSGMTDEPDAVIAAVRAVLAD